MASAPESHVDVLIIGAGPAGLMMATWMAKCGIRTRIVDKRGTAVFTGQADGLSSRTLEILDALGFGHRAWRESNHMLEFCMWNPDTAGVLRRSDRLPDTAPGISRFQQAVMHQGRIERFFLDEIEARSDIRVERGVMPTSLAIDETAVEDPAAYPVTVTLRRLTEQEATPKQQQQQQQQQQATTSGQHPVQDGLFRSNLTEDDTEELLAGGRGAEEKQEETVRARYLVGADGAHSWTRKQLGVSLEGESTDYVWGVLDMVPVTDFPDIRMRCAIHSAAAGSIMIIPRENKLVRVYVQLSSAAAAAATAPGQRADRSGITPEAILAEAQRIMAPYTITYRKLDWWTAYQIGQRVGTKFSVHERVFLAGDAVHTHSPKAGQGMNVSMQDTFNLGWKVASVLQGQASRSILQTYELERRQVAQDLIAFDRKFSRLFSGRPAKDDSDTEGIRMADFKAAFAQSLLFTSGTVADYGPSAITAKAAAAVDGENCGTGTGPRGVLSEQHLAPGIPVGMRIPSVKVLNQADARPWHLQELLPGDGRWRVLVLPGDLRRPLAAARLRALADHFAARDAFPARFTPPADAGGGARPDAVFELLLVHAAPRTAVTIFDVPDVFRRFSDADGYDYGKIFVDDASYHEGHGNLYAEFGVAEEGCVVVVRPDQHVSYVGSMREPEAVTEFFAGFMIPQIQ